MADYNVNKNTLTTSGAFHSLRYSPTVGIGLYLENWYQADSMSEKYATTYITDMYKSMIATGNDIMWYTGADSGVEKDYTLSKTGTKVLATIGMGYYGEVFSSQFGNGKSSSVATWLITRSPEGFHWSVAADDEGIRSHSEYQRGVRPSMYLKFDVKIKSGNGQPSSPYKLYQ